MVSSRIRKYMQPSAYWRFLRYTLRAFKKPTLPSSERPIFWTGTGACGFLRTYKLLHQSGKRSIYFKSRAKLQNHNTHQHPERELLWERGENVQERVKAYFVHEGVYDHHIAPYTLRYAKEILEHFENKSVFLYLRSNKSARSLWIQWGYRNPLIADRAQSHRYPVELYPDLSMSARSSREAVEQYVDLYHEEAEELAAAYPDNFHIVDADRFFSDEDYFNSLNDAFDLKLTFVPQTLECDSDLVTTSLDGGFGNNLFQMAEVVAFCAEHTLPPPKFATWDMSRFPPSYRNDRFLGGHSGSPEELTHAFPNSRWTTPSPASFDDKFMVTDMFSFEDAHPQRAAILSCFKPPDEMKQELERQYPAITKTNTISLHYRTGGQTADTRSFKALDATWYQKVLTTHFPERFECFVFSDNIPAAKILITHLEKTTNHSYHLVDKGVFPSIVLMSMCRNHILSNSTLSFWGAYLDPHQPEGITILHPSFLTYHREPHFSCRMIPYPQWKLVGST